MRRAVATVLTAVAGIVAVVAGLPAHAATWTPTSYSARLLTLVNNARAQDGLPPLRQADGTTTVAAAWAEHLASARTLAHNPDLRHQLETHGSADWTVYGENVGSGSSSNPDQLFRAYWASTEHRDNILTRGFRYVGVATVFTGDTAWNTFDFVDEYSDSAPPTTGGSLTSGGRVASRPARPAAARQPVAAPQPPAQPATTAAHLPVQRSPRHLATAVAPRVRALRSEWARLPPAAAAHASGDPVPVPTLAAASSPFQLGSAAGARRARAVAFALALLALAAAARRWVLVAVPRQPATVAARP